MRKLAFIAVFVVSGCQSVPIINRCPPPPDATMVLAGERPKLDPALAKPFPGVSGLWIGARDTYSHMLAVESYADVNAARLTALQDWGRTQCGWALSKDRPSPSQDGK